MSNAVDFLVFNDFLPPGIRTSNLLVTGATLQSFFYYRYWQNRLKRT